MSIVSNMCNVSNVSNDGHTSNDSNTSSASNMSSDSKVSNMSNVSNDCLFFHFCSWPIITIILVDHGLNIKVHVIIQVVGF